MFPDLVDQTDVWGQMLVDRVEMHAGLIEGLVKREDPAIVVGAPDFNRNVNVGECANTKPWPRRTLCVFGQGLVYRR